MSTENASSSIVFDASAAIDLLLAQEERSAWVAESIAGARHLVAPHVIDTEVASALRGLVIGGGLTGLRGSVALDDFKRLRIRRYPTTRLLERIWELRHGLTAYDATYVALAEALDLPLLTTDERLGRTTGHRAEIVAYPG